MITGAMSNSQQRQQLVDKYQASQEEPLFFLLSKAASVGATLTRAACVILVEASYNPATEAQAVHRAYRYGQRSEVEVYRLICLDSCEEAVCRRGIQKRCLATHINDGVDSEELSETALPPLGARAVLPLLMCSRNCKRRGPSSASSNTTRTSSTRKRS